MNLSICPAQFPMHRLANHTDVIISLRKAVTRHLGELMSKLTLQRRDSFLPLFLSLRVVTFSQHRS